MRSVFGQNCFKKCDFRIGGGSLQFETARFKIANFRKRSAKRLAFYVFIKKRAFLAWKRGAKLTLNHALLNCWSPYQYFSCGNLWLRSWQWSFCIYVFLISSWLLGWYDDILIFFFFVILDLREEFLIEYDFA